MSSLSILSELVSFLYAKSDVAIEEAVCDVGVDVALDQVFAGLCQRFRPERGWRERAVLEWKLATPAGPRCWQLELGPEACCASASAASVANATLKTSLATFLRLVTGQLNALAALANAELEVSGDSELALRHQLWFGADLSRATLDVATPRQLGHLIEGRSDAEIAAGVAIAGVDRSLRQVFGGMVEHYLPRKGPGRRAAIEFSVQTEQGLRVYQFVADSQQAAWHAGTQEPAKVSLQIGMPDLLRLVSGRLDGFAALAQRKLKVRGNLFMASGIQGWFDLSR
jgi:putative sterol carrier protein